MKTKPQTNVDTIKELLHLYPKNGEKFCRLEYRNSAENSFKFYELSIEPTATPGQMQLVAKWGRIGSSAQSKVYYTGSIVGCRTEASSIQREKEKKGYKKVS